MALTTPVLDGFKPIGPRPIRWHYKAAQIHTHSLPVVVLLCCCHPPPSPSPLCCLYELFIRGIISLFAPCLIFYVCCSLMLEAGSASPRYIHYAKVKPIISMSMVINKCSNLVSERLDWIVFIAISMAPSLSMAANSYTYSFVANGSSKQRSHHWVLSIAPDHFQLHPVPGFQDKQATGTQT